MHIPINNQSAVKLVIIHGVNNGEISAYFARKKFSARFLDPVLTAIWEGVDGVCSTDLRLFTSTKGLKKVYTSS